MHRIPGGSAANVTKGLTNIMKEGVSAQFIGMIGKDATGSEYRERLQSHGVKPLLLVGAHTQTRLGCGLCNPPQDKFCNTLLGVAGCELEAAAS